MLGELAKKEASRTDLMRAARNLVIARNWHNWRNYLVTRLSLGEHVHILSLR